MCNITNHLSKFLRVQWVNISLKMLFCFFFLLMAKHAQAQIMLPAYQGVYSRKTSVEGSVIADGLLLNLDAGKTASYSGTGTTWNDISGNGNNGTLNGAVFTTTNGGKSVV